MLLELVITFCLAQHPKQCGIQVDTLTEAASPSGCAPLAQSLGMAYVRETTGLVQHSWQCLDWMPISAKASGSL